LPGIDVTKITNINSKASYKVIDKNTNYFYKNTICDGNKTTLVDNMINYCNKQPTSGSPSFTCPTGSDTWTDPTTNETYSYCTQQDLKQTKGLLTEFAKYQKSCQTCGGIAGLVGDQGYCCKP
jgi:hypothetical protein